MKTKTRRPINLPVEPTMWMAMETFKFFGLSFPSVHAIYAALGNRKFDLRPKWKLRVTTIYIRKYGLGFSPPLFLNGSQTCDALFRLPRSTNFCLRYTSLSVRAVQAYYLLFSWGPFQSVHPGIANRPSTFSRMTVQWVPNQYYSGTKERKEGVI